MVYNQICVVTCVYASLLHVIHRRIFSRHDLQSGTTGQGQAASLDGLGRRLSRAGVRRSDQAADERLLGRCVRLAILGELVSEPTFESLVFGTSHWVSP